jgi:hypothetical protein
MPTAASIAYPLMLAPVARIQPAEAQRDGTALGMHLRHCANAQGRWFSMQCLVEATHAFLAPRFVTTLVAATLVFGVVSMLS